MMFMRDFRVIVRQLPNSWDDAHNRPIFVRKFHPQVPSCGSSMEDDEEVNSTSLHPFDRTLKMVIQLHEKKEMAKYSNK